MKVTFLGVGEAFDENNTHTCILVEAAGRRMLVDCGATAPPSVWHQSKRPDYLDGIFISHFHADHVFWTSCPYDENVGRWKNKAILPIWTCWNSEKCRKINGSCISWNGC